MVRPKRERPKRYKSYIRAFEEAQNETPDIPESTLRSQRKRKLLEDLSCSSSSSLDMCNNEAQASDEAADLEADDSLLVIQNCQDNSDKSQASSQTFGENKSITSSHQSTYGSAGNNSEIESDEGNMNSLSSKTSSQATFENDVSLWSADEPAGKNSELEKNEAGNVESLSSETSSQASLENAGSCYSESESSGSDSERDSHDRNVESLSSETSSQEILDSDESCHSAYESAGDHSGIDSDEGNLDSSSPETSSQASGGNEVSGSEFSLDTGNDGGPLELFKNLKMKLQDSFKNPLNITVTASIGDIMTNVLALVKKHNWNHTEKEDLMKFVNALLNKEAVPSSRFLLDKYFYCKDGMQYHFFCSLCTNVLLDVSATQLTQTQIRCSNQSCSKINDISDLSKASYFVTYDLPSQLKHLLDDPAIRNKLLNPCEFIEEPEDAVMSDLHHGSCYRSFANHINKLENHTNARYISFSLSVDAASLCKFSRQSICPCFIMLNELPPVLRMKNLLIAGLWFGVQKEKLYLFLPPIVQHITELSTTGFTLQFHEEVWQVKAFLIACVADSVARCDVQGIHSHRGDYPCSWCLCEGEEYVNKRIFPYDGNLPPPRTIRGLMEDAREAERTHSFVRGVKYLCLLSPAPLFHPVHGFVVDQMHAKDEGCTKSFLHSWLGEDGKAPYYIGKANIRKVNQLLQEVKIPRELRKSIRSLTHLKFWIGREMENWAFFLSLSVLPGILPQRYLYHWALYVQGTFMLLNSNVHQTVVTIAEQLLDEFCIKTEGLYGQHMMKFNLHILLHFVENCRRWGPLFALSAYAFEAGNQRLKKLVHDCNGIPNQICRGISEENAFLILKESCDSTMTQSFQKSIEPKSHATRVKFVDKIQLLGVSRSFKPSAEEKWHFDQKGVFVEDCVEYKLIRKDGCHYGPGPTSRQSKTDNSFAKLKNQNIIHIQKIIHNEKTNEVWVLGNRVRYQPSEYCHKSVVQYDSSLCCQFRVTSIDEDLSIYDASELATVCVNMSFAHGHFISVMPNIFNMY